MKTRKRPNFGLFLLIAVVAGALFYSFSTAASDKHDLAAGLERLQVAAAEEAAAVIFPESAIADSTVSPDELEAAKANLSRVLSQLYPEESLREARYLSLSRDLEQQGEETTFLRSFTLTSIEQTELNREGNVWKFTVDNLQLDAVIQVDGETRTLSDYTISPAYEALYRSDNESNVLLDQTLSPVSRLLGEQFNYAARYEPEREMPWNRRPF